MRQPDVGHVPDVYKRQLYYQYYDYPAVGSVRAHYGIRTDRYKPVSYTHLWELSTVMWALSGRESFPEPW